MTADAVPAGRVTLREMIEQTPPGTLFSREGLLQKMEEMGDGPEPENVTTVGASQRLGRSTKWWRMLCQRGAIEGARQDEAGRWYFPLASARAYLAGKRQSPSTRKIRRGPNRKGRAKFDPP